MNVATTLARVDTFLAVMSERTAIFDRTFAVRGALTTLRFNLLEVLFRLDDAGRQYEADKVRVQMDQLLADDDEMHRLNEVILGMGLPLDSPELAPAFADLSREVELAVKSWGIPV